MVFELLLKSFLPFWPFLITGLYAGQLVNKKKNKKKRKRGMFVLYISFLGFF